MTRPNSPPVPASLPRRDPTPSQPTEVRPSASRGLRRANRAGADTRPRPHANARGKGSPMPGRSAG